MARLLILAGLVLLTIGLVVLMVERLGIGRLPGDIVIERESFTLYIPIATSLIVSVVLTLLFWLLSR